MPRKVRNYKDEAKYHAQPEQKKNRALRNAARRKAISEGKVTKGDGKDLDHTKPLSKGGTNAKGNVKVMKAGHNRSFKRNAKGGIK